MERSRNWWVFLLGPAVVVLALVGLLISGEPPSATDDGVREGVREVTEFYVDNETEVIIGVIFEVLLAAALVWFGSALLGVLRAGRAEWSILPTVAFTGLAIVATGFAIDASISLALIQAADEGSPASVEALSVLFENDFIPFALGTFLFLIATGIAVVTSGVLPKWLGWIMILFGILAATPIGFVSFGVMGLLVGVIGVILAMRARKGTAPTSVAGGAPPSPA